MDVTPRGILLNWFPNLPNLAKTTALSLLGWGEKSKHQDAITQILAECLRPFLRSPSSLLKSQRVFTYDFGLWGPAYVAKWTIPRSEDPSLDGESGLSVSDAVAYAISTLSTRPEEMSCEMPTVDDVDTEWVGYRHGALYRWQQSQTANEDAFAAMMQGIDKDCPTILYAHGGAFCLMDPANHRITAAMLAGKAAARVLAVRYRLSPQAVFPAALIDMFIAYLALLSPPSTAYHKPVSASRIVIAGDSSGGGLAASLQLLLLELIRRQRHKIHFLGRIVTIPNPPCAAISLTSPWLDVARSLPSTSRNCKWDVIAPPPLDAASPPFPPDEIWPASPPRAETYCTARMVAHPLVSPLTAPKSLLAIMPPLYMLTGWESMQDECEVFCRRVFLAKQDGSQVMKPANIEFEGWEGMFHTFSFLPFNHAGWSAVENRAKHISDAVNGKVKQKATGTWYSSVHEDTKSHVPLDRLGLGSAHSGYFRQMPLTDGAVDTLVQKARLFRVELEDTMVVAWKSG